VLRRPTWPTLLWNAKGTGVGSLDSLIATPRHRWWVTPLTTIVVAVVKTLIEDWPWTK
jgi:hypothetical protein